MTRRAWNRQRLCRTAPSAARRWSLAHALCFALTGAVFFLIPHEGGANQQMVGMDQDNTTVHLNVDDLLAIELPGNAGTGFEWRFDALDDQFFVLMERGEKKFEVDDPRHMGGRYHESWTVKALLPGRSEIRLLYYRPWEGKLMAEKRFTVKVVIKP